MSRNRRRDTFDIAKTGFVVDDVRDAQTDHRVYNPSRPPRVVPTTDVIRSTRQFRREVFRKQVPASYKRDFLSPESWLVHPHETMVCFRRAVRRAVLFAKGGSGRGKRRRRPRFNQGSLIHCRR